jgi:uncharacterized protein (DUF58 family)
VVLVSDLHTQDSEHAALSDALRTTAARHELVALRIEDPHERRMPDVGPITLEDAESHEVVVLDTGRAHVRRLFAEATAARARRLTGLVHAAGARLFELSTDQDYVPTLIRLFSGSFDPRRGIA